MYSDEIIRQVWRNRDDYVASMGHDLEKIAIDLKKRQVARDSRLVDRRKKKSEQVA